MEATQLTTAWASTAGSDLGDRESPSGRGERQLFHPVAQLLRHDFKAGMDRDSISMRSPPADSTNCRYSKTKTAPLLNMHRLFKVIII